MPAWAAWKAALRHVWATCIPFGEAQAYGAFCRKSRLTEVSNGAGMRRSRGDAGKDAGMAAWKAALRHVWATFIRFGRAQAYGPFCRESRPTGASNVAGRCGSSGDARQGCRHGRLKGGATPRLGDLHAVWRGAGPWTVLSKVAADGSIQCGWQVRLQQGCRPECRHGPPGRRRCATSGRLAFPLAGRRPTERSVESRG